MTFYYRIMGVAAILIAVAFSVVSVGFNLSGTHTLFSATLVVLIACVSLIAGTLTVMAFRTGKVLPCIFVGLIIVGCFFAEGFNFARSAKQVFALDSLQTRSIDVKNRPIALAEAKVVRLREALQGAVEASAKEANNGRCKTKCKNKARLEEAARVRLAEAETALAQLPPPHKDSDPFFEFLSEQSGVRIGLLKDLVALAAPITLLLFSYGFAGLGGAFIIHSAPADVATARVVVDQPKSDVVVPLGMTRAQAKADLLGMLAKGECIPEQKVLVDRWDCTEGCVSKWLSVWESDGLINRQRDGKQKSISIA